ncbi:DUF3949 domain-containing protein [Robertmurraya yapensis]|uniref:DUF3949 domain-containing protein n=2 Tax=Bacillaceae TaxID=186817 RepID=A0A3S0RSX5_9BACI|nr:DUF3949 domain-containing protein [Bacillus yapensis]RTR35524.1 DUF3949 domain-containing protein [Bacillus yapensis]TKS98325.1 DUF3949 domain-containing protein [Bacillus yapensis]
MGSKVILGIILAYILLSFILLPIQYRYIKELKEMDKERKALGLSQNEYYEKMSFENEQLHFNAQGNPLFIGANILATLLYKWRHKK